MVAAVEEYYDHYQREAASCNIERGREVADGGGGGRGEGRKGRERGGVGQGNEEGMAQEGGRWNNNYFAVVAIFVSLQIVRAESWFFSGSPAHCCCCSDVDFDNFSFNTTSGKTSSEPLTYTHTQVKCTHVVCVCVCVAENVPEGGAAGHRLR